MRKRVFSTLLICLLLAGCADPEAVRAHTATVYAMDTVMQLTAYGRSADRALGEAETELQRLDALLARGVEGSAVHRLNGLGGVNDTTVSYLLLESEKIAEATDGAFDPTVAPLLGLWGFGSGAGEHRVPSEDELAAALEAVGMERVHIEGAQVGLDGGEVDLGGVAKGWAGQRVRDILSENGVTSAVIDLGGDVALLGKKPGGADWRVAVRDPASGGFLGVLTASDCFVMTSGVYERYFEEDGAFYHHILDPKTGRPADSGIVSATVICENGVWADALATAACVMGAERALALRESLAEAMPFDLILVTDDARALYTCDSFTPDADNDYAYEHIS